MADPSAPESRVFAWFRSLPGLFMIVRRSLRQHALSTSVTVLSVALAIGLTMAVFSVSAQTRKAFTGGPVGFDAVLGARGSQLQLVMNTVFHLETSPGNIPWSLYESVRNDPTVELAIPYAVGDNYRGFRIVGTTQEMFTKFEYQKDRGFQIQPPGRVFETLSQEAVIGSRVAEKTGLTYGSKFNAFHGVVYDERQKHDQEFTVVGVLEPTNSPSDKVIWIPVEGVYLMDGHVLRKGNQIYKPKRTERIPAEFKELSAVMIKFKNPALGWPMSQTVNNQGKVATLAWPIGKVMAELFDKMGWVTEILRLVAYMVVLVAAASILASIYNTMNERRREFAILRALGASRGTVFAVIVFEAKVIAILGCLVGFVVYGLILWLVAVVVRQQTGVALDLLAFDWALVWTPVSMIVLGSLSGLLPAFKAYRTDVASNLLPTS